MSESNLTFTCLQTKQMTGTIPQSLNQIVKSSKLNLSRSTISPNPTVPYKVTLNMDDMNTSSIPK